MLSGPGALNRVGAAVASSLSPASAALNLDFTLGTLDDRITFTRASTATYFDKDGVLQSAAADEARFDYDPSTLAPRGLLIEEQRANLLLQSEDFSTTWAATGSTVSTNATTAPSGAATADKLIANSAITVSSSSVSAFVRQDITKAASATTYTFSVFAKAGEFDAIRIFARDNATSANNAVVSALLTNGTVLTAAAASGTFTNASVAITNVGNGWYRVALTFTSSTETAIRFIYAVNDSSTTTGDASKGIFIWGAQLEAGAFPTSYIPTTTTALTRNADAASMTGTNFSGWYNANQGTFFTEYQVIAIAPATAAQTLFHVSDGTASNAIQAYKRANADVSTRFAVGVGGAANQAFLSAGTFVATLSKFSGAYEIDNFAACLNSGSVAADTSGNVPTVSQLDIGAQVTGLNYLNGHIRRIAYYPTRLANSTLQALTA
jgi:hypothetical protein